MEWKIEDIIKPIIEKWAGTKVRKLSKIYGIRRYLRGAQLLLHVDKYPTHILSAILQFDQKVDEEWPLLLIDFEGVKKKVYLKPGEMVLYESAKLLHGRQIPLNGTFFDNLFVHFRTLNH